MLARLRWCFGAPGGFDQAVRRTIEGRTAARVSEPLNDVRSIERHVNEHDSKPSFSAPEIPPSPTLLIYSPINIPKRKGTAAPYFQVCGAYLSALQEVSIGASGAGSRF